MDSEDGSLIVHLESEALSDNKDSIIEIMTSVYQEFPQIKSRLLNCTDFGCYEVSRTYYFNQNVSL